VITHSGGREPGQESRAALYFVIAVATMSAVYNALLAIINAHVVSMNFALVAGTELSILLACLLFVLKRGIFADDTSILLFLGFALVFLVHTSLASGSPYIDYFRNILIIACFAMVGSWASARTVKAAFYVTSALVTVFLVIEVFSLELYAWILKPGLYFENTRGLKQASYNDTGLFANALGFKGRLSFGIIGHRASSLFLEQVSLSNFAGVAMMYLLYFWGQMGRLPRTLIAAMIPAILLTTASRTMLIFSGVCFLGFFLFPRIPKAWSLLVMPLILLAGLMLLTFNPEASGDNIAGRVVLTMRHLMETDIYSMLGFNAKVAIEFADSGYVYIIYASTLLGLPLFWLFVTFYPSGITAPQRRLVHALAVFLFLNLMIGATPVFTAKIAGLLWLLVGHAKFAHLGGRTAPVTDAIPAPLADREVYRT
jgi:hypothetical protein